MPKTISLRHGHVPARTPPAMSHKMPKGVGCGVSCGIFDRILCAIGLGLLLAGCTYSGPTNPSVTNTVPGQLPAVGPPPGIAPAPPGMAAAPSPSPQNGHYAGTGIVMSNQGDVCSQQIRVTNFIVDNGHVSFGAYHGTIQADGSLHMQAGPTYVYGQFMGSHFDGRFWRPPPGCTYDLSLDPVS
jgi:hypothetical protein